LPLIHWNIHYHRGNFWRLHLSLYLDIQILLFVIWLAIDSESFAWFTIPLFTWGILLGVHYAIRRRLLRSNTTTVKQPSPLSNNDPEKGQQSNSTEQQSTEQQQSTESPLPTPFASVPSLYPTIVPDTQQETPLYRKTGK